MEHGTEPVLIGRRDETRHISGLLGAARTGTGGALVLRGEAGIGKSALLDFAGRDATGFRVVRCSGSRFESDLPFAALHQLCLSLLPHGAGLPDTQREAVQRALDDGSAPTGAFRTNTAVLSLVTTVARDRPLLILVDDAQWLDTVSARTLAFTARRLSAEPVVVLAAQRTPCRACGLDDLPAHVLTGLADEEARTLLPDGGDPRVLERLRAEARGNPLGLRQRLVAGGYAPADTATAPCRVERRYQERFTRASETAKLLLAVASADPTGSPALFWAAARRLGVGMPAAGAVLTGTGLAEVGARVLFCHPLARSACYRAADPRLRRIAHLALAAVTDPDLAPDRRAWHRAQACAGPDDEVAAELERVSPPAGGAGAAAFLERAATLTVDDDRRTDRVLRAAQAHLDAGDTGRAATLLAAVESAALHTEGQVRYDRLRARVAFTRNDGGDGPGLLLSAAERLAEQDPRRSRQYRLDAVEMSLMAGRSDAVTGRLLTGAPGDPQPDLLDVGRLLFGGEHHAAVPLLRDLLREDNRLYEQRPALSYLFTAVLWDPRASADGVGNVMRAARESGSPDTLRLGLSLGASHAAFTGDLTTANALTAREEALARAGGRPPALCHRLHVAAMAGRPRETSELVTRILDASDRTGYLAANAHWATAVTANARTAYPAAMAAAEQAVALGDPLLIGVALPELIEASVRTRRTDRATAALTDLARRTTASATATALGVTAYCRALTTDDEGQYREAVDLLSESLLLPYRGRAHLLYGEWLRRRGRLGESRGQLQAAHRIFTDTSMEAFAKRAATELTATGTAGRPAQPSTGLTSQEQRIAQLVAAGATTKEVATELFLSPRTVDAHLRSIFQKTGITSRRELRRRDGR